MKCRDSSNIEQSRCDWLQDMDKHVVMVYDFEHDNMEEYSFGTYIPVGIYEGFSIKVQ